MNDFVVNFRTLFAPKYWKCGLVNIHLDGKLLLYDVHISLLSINLAQSPGLPFCFF